MIANPSQPVALTIAGSDSSGGAGIQADLKTFAALGVHGASAITAVTAQNTKRVAAIELMTPAFVCEQIKAVAEGTRISAVKTGMLGDSATINAVSKALDDLPPHVLVIDPVMVATSGALLIDDESVGALKHVLLPKATLCTPNLDEAAALLGGQSACMASEMENQARRLSDLFDTAVLLKGGHLPEPDSEPTTALDVLASNGKCKWFKAPFVVGADTHGTGCTLSAAIAATCAKGSCLETAISEAKAYVTDALLASRA